MEKRAEFIRKKLLEFYKGSIPDYVVDAGKSHITIRIQETPYLSRDYVVTICSVHEYFTSENDKDEGELAGISGDPNFIYKLALECLRWFKFVSPEEFK
ncbi:MAG: hypothetical protein N2738_01550 [Thermodesulfovibrionales bacterium]|nr:hypothetical protein [Thermodesulfovibrionales bacterium]